MRITRLFKEFFESEKSAGLILIFCTGVSLFLSNSTIQSYYFAIWDYEFAGHTFLHWINDGLMTVFFLLIGLELEREIYDGELSDIKNALLPISGAIGGMIVPASIYLLFNFGTSTQSGIAIPMATDIAFALGILSLLGNRVPLSLKVFLTALAVIDDLGAVIVIALFYTKTLVWTNLFIALGIFLLLLVFNRMKVHSLIPYVLGGIVMWYFMLHSGVHATISGVLLAFAIPFGDGKDKSPSFILQHTLHKPVAYFILPLFACANTAIALSLHTFQDSFVQPFALGIFFGLVVGKSVGIMVFSYFSVFIGLCKLPSDINWKQLSGVGFLGGIGFTMSIFITLLAFDESDIINNSKIMILLASLIAGTVGYFWLKQSLENNQTINSNNIN
ncbi:MAG: Na+/H+ antiporter NhaA [Ignavibacteriae bacterium]|nr:Na+/H+ antiporter NhaA [Ignavibacteriota bacterium]